MTAFLISGHISQTPNPTTMGNKITITITSHITFTNIHRVITHI